MRAKHQPEHQPGPRPGQQPVHQRDTSGGTAGTPTGHQRGHSGTPAQTPRGPNEGRGGTAVGRRSGTRARCHGELARNFGRTLPDWGSITGLAPSTSDICIYIYMYIYSRRALTMNVVLECFFNTKQKSRGGAPRRAPRRAAAGSQSRNTMKVYVESLPEPVEDRPASARFSTNSHRRWRSIFDAK